MTIPVKQRPYPFADSVAMAITDAKRRLRLSDKKLAERADVSRRHLAELQKGSNVTLLVAQKVMRALGLHELALGEEERLTVPKPKEDTAALQGAAGELELAAALLLKAAGTVKDGLPPAASSGVRSHLAARASHMIDDFADFVRTLDSEEKMEAVEQLWQASVAPVQEAPAPVQQKKRKSNRRSA